MRQGVAVFHACLLQDLSHRCHVLACRWSKASDGVAHQRNQARDVLIRLIAAIVILRLGPQFPVFRQRAVDLRKKGMSVIDATIQAGEERLRPIIMTSLAFIFGVLPLAIASGAGANARHSIGTGIMGGMIGEATLAMLYVPLFFYIFDRLAERGKKEIIPPEGFPSGGPLNLESTEIIANKKSFWTLIKWKSKISDK